MKRLSEPAEDTPKTYSSGGYVGTGSVIGEVDKGCYVPSRPMELSPETARQIQEVARKSVHLGKYNALR